MLNVNYYDRDCIKYYILRREIVTSSYLHYYQSSDKTKLNKFDLIEKKRNY